MRHSNVLECSTDVLQGRKCVFCGSLKLNRTRRGYIKCRTCLRQKSVKRLQREIAIIQGFSQQVPAYRLAHELAVDVKVISRVYRKLRAAIFVRTELEGMDGTVSAELKLDQVHFGGSRMGARGTVPSGKRVAVRLVGRDGRVYTKIVGHGIVDTVMTSSPENLPKGPVDDTDWCNVAQLHQRDWTHSGRNAPRLTKNRIKGIAGFWAFAKPILSNYRGISNDHFPMYLKEVEFRFNHRKENLFTLFLDVYFGYISPQL